MLDTHVELGDVERGLRALAQAGRDAGPFLQAVKKPLRTDQRQHQREKRGPDSAWPGPSAGTVRKRGRTKSGRRRSKRPLGKLPGLLTVRVENRDTLVARSRVPWARVQQEGGRVGRGAQLPPRPFLYFGDEFVDDTRAALAEYLSDAWGRR